MLKEVKIFAAVVPDKEQPNPKTAQTKVQLIKILDVKIRMLITFIETVIGSKTCTVQCIIEKPAISTKAHVIIAAKRLIYIVPLFTGRE